LLSLAAMPRSFKRSASDSLARADAAATDESSRDSPRAILISECAVAHELERRGNDVALFLRELSGVVRLRTASSATTTAALPLTISRSRKADLHEEDVRRRALRAAHAIVVGRARR